VNDIKSFDFAWSYTKVPLLANAPHFRNASAASGCEEVRSISNPPADVYLGGGFELDVFSGGHYFLLFYNYYFLFCLMKMEYSIFKMEEKEDGNRNLFGTGRFNI
jgi:hypothetical protein